MVTFESESCDIFRPNLASASSRDGRMSCGLEVPTYRALTSSRHASTSFAANGHRRGARCELGRRLPTTATHLRTTRLCPAPGCERHRHVRPSVYSPRPRNSRPAALPLWPEIVVQRELTKSHQHPISTIEHELHVETSMLFIMAGG